MSKENGKDFGPTVGFVEEHSTTDDKGTTRVTRADYLKFMSQHGVTKEILATTGEAHDLLYGASVLVAAQKLAKDVEKAKESGDSPDDLKHVVDVAIPGASIRAEVKTKSVSPNPRHQEHGGPEKIVTIGHSSLKIKVKSLLPGQAVDEAKEIVRQALGESA